MRAKLVESIFDDPDASMDKLFKGMGITYESGIITPTSRFGKMLCFMALKDGRFEKIDEKTYKLKDVDTYPKDSKNYGPRGDMDTKSWGDPDDWRGNEMGS